MSQDERSKLSSALRLSTPHESQGEEQLKGYKPQGISRQLDNEGMFQELACRLQDIQNHQKITDHSNYI